MDSDEELAEALDAHEVESAMQTYAEEVEEYEGFDIDQKMAIDRVMEEKFPRECVGILGHAGCGKTTIINHLERALTRFYEKDGRGKRVVVTATTTQAASLLGPNAQTTYKVMKFTMQKCEKTDTYYPGNDWRRYKPQTLACLYGDIGTLIIDEVSMLPAAMLDEIDKLFQEVHSRHDIPFGGVQVVLVGDFKQLPPIDEFGPKHLYYAGLKQFAFLGEVWKRAFSRSAVLLKTNHRQAGDDALKGLLAMIREGRLTSAGRALLISRERETPPDEAACVCPKVAQADQHNGRYLASIAGELLTFQGRMLLCRDPARPSVLDVVGFRSGDAGVPTTEKELRGKFIVPFKTVLKVGCRVMIAAPMPPPLYNGAQGVFLGMTTDVFGAEVMLVRMNLTQEVHEIGLYQWRTQLERNGRVLVYEHYPVLIGRAITIHKCQGMSLDAIFVEADCFEDGQFYVACSRVRTLNGLFIAAGFSTSDIITSDIVRSFYATLGGLDI